jgi:hypothetical protein
MRLINWAYSSFHGAPMSARAELNKHDQFLDSRHEELAFERGNDAFNAQTDVVQRAAHGRKYRVSPSS